MPASIQTVSFSSRSSTATGIAACSSVGNVLVHKPAAPVVATAEDTSWKSKRLKTDSVYV